MELRVRPATGRVDGRTLNAEQRLAGWQTVVGMEGPPGDTPSNLGYDLTGQSHTVCSSDPRTTLTDDPRPPLPPPIMRLINSRFYRNAHRWLFRWSGGRLGAHINRMDTLLLTTTGRKSGREHTVPLLCLPDGDALVVVASNGGSGSHPSWWYNLQAHPEVSVTTRDGIRPMGGRSATAAEEARMWPRLTDTNEMYGYYPHVTERTIPLVYLEPRE